MITGRVIIWAVGWGYIRCFFDFRFIEFSF